MAYELALPPSLLVVHLVFHVSMLKKSMLDGSHILDEELDITLRRKDIPLVKVL